VATDKAVQTEQVGMYQHPGLQAHPRCHSADRVVEQPRRAQRREVWVKQPSEETMWRHTLWQS
jgi:hypothetical protein